MLPLPAPIAADPAASRDSIAFSGHEAERTEVVPVVTLDSVAREAGLLGVDGGGAPVRLGEVSILKIDTEVGV